MHRGLSHLDRSGFCSMITVQLVWINTINDDRRDQKVNICRDEPRRPPEAPEKLERVKGIEPSYSAWKSDAFARFFNGFSDKSRPNNHIIFKHAARDRHMIPRRFGTGCHAVCRDSRVRFGPRLGHAAWRYRTIRSRQPDTQPSITSLAAFWIRQALMQARVASLHTTPLI